MKKKWALYLGNILGIKVFIHWTFVILLAWVFLMHTQMGHGFSEAIWGVVFILALFACVILHEFGHALTAKRYNIPTKDVTVYPIGGVATLESMPRKPKQELVVALAGPAVNIVIAAALWIYMQLSATMPDWTALRTADHMQTLPFAFNLFAANIILAVFNLIPAFPMDGGRVLRALLALKMDRAKATRIAAGVGQFLAMVLVFLGFFYNFWLVFIGLFIYLGAGSEATFEATHSILAGYDVRKVLMTRFTTLLPGDSLEKAVQILLDGKEQDFLVATDGQVQGVLSRKELIQGLSAFGKSSPVMNSMRTDFTMLSPDMSLQDVYSKMMTKGYKVYPVQENGKLLGMVDKENISELILVQQALSEK